MHTLENFLAKPPQIPTATVWLLTDLAEYRGKQKLFTHASGCQDVRTWIHATGEGIPLNVPTILRLHSLSRPDTWDGGQFKEQGRQIIETLL